MTSPDGAPVQLALALLRTDGGTQPRAELSDALIDEYAEAMRAGVVFPPVVVYYDGEFYWLTDGYHRFQAAGRCNLSTIAAEIRQGTLAEAQWYSYSVNKAHGLRRTNDDKRRAVEAALRHPFGSRYSDNELAKHCGVSGETIRRYRQTIFQNVEDVAERIVTRNGRTYPMNTANIGRRDNPTPPAPTPAQPAAIEPIDALPTPVIAPRPAASSLPAPDAHPAPQVPAPAPMPVVATITREAAPLPTLGLPPAVHDVGPLVKIIQGDARCDYGLTGVHLVITSPPYNVGIEYGAHNDNLSDADYNGLLAAAFANCHRAMVDGARIAVIVPFGVGRNPWRPLAGRVQTLLVAAGFTLRGQIVWDKASTGNRTTWGSFRLPSNPSLRDTTEAIVIAHKGAPQLPLPPNVVLHDAKGSHTHWLAEADDFMALAQDHWQVAPESAQRIGHPAPFPVALAERLIRFYGYPACHVHDPFAGSGTVGVAAARLRCRATLVEIDPTYIDLALGRCREEVNRD